jgi:prepilin-type N-terminal cleavage/methylation domain-containing protein
MRTTPMPSKRKHTREAGFTLLELMVAAVIFTIISGAAFSLMASHQPLFQQQQNLAEVNISLRNAIAQMQTDIANAGANYYTGANIPNYPVGVVVSNNPVASGGDCRTGSPLQYTATCFDSMSIITADSTTPPTNPMSSTSGCIDTSSVQSGTSGTAYLSPAGSTGYGTGATAPAAATTAAGKYLSGDQILFVNSNGSLYTSAALTAAGATTKVGTNWYVLLKYGVTTSTGLNTSVTNDPYGMSTKTNSMLSNSYCSTDWVLRLLPITYSVDISTATNPQLTRTVAGLSQTLSQKTLATQIIGFKIGASLFNSTTDQETTVYCFDAKAYDPNCPSITAGSAGSWTYNYTFVRSVMVSLIGRTNPNPDPTYVFRNSFDSGPYEIQGVSVVINPRNMSMTDN